jgi:hypothetical protein
MTHAPILCMYADGVFKPVNRYHARVAEIEFGAGELVPLVRHEDRSEKSHRHFFAAVNEAWKSLPDHLAEQYPTPEHLRKAALIRTGYADQATHVCASKAEALRTAAFISPMNTYAIVSTKEATVTVWTAQSQSVKAMGKAEFQASKDKVLDWIANLLGVTRDQLPKEEAA